MKFLEKVKAAMLIFTEAKASAELIQLVKDKKIFMEVRIDNNWNTGICRHTVSFYNSENGNLLRRNAYANRSW